MMDNKETLSEELKLFREAMEDVRPLTVDDRTPKPKKKPAAIVRQYKREDSDSPPSVTAEEFLDWQVPGVSKRSLYRLKQGNFVTEKEIDLHGLTAEEAKSQVDASIKGAYRRKQRYLLIIHGKGLHSDAQYPVLKNTLNNTLRQNSKVLAFCSAQARDGGAGALYVLLSKGP